MGAWGNGPFEDDTAYDVVDSVKENPSWATVRQYLDVCDKNFVEYPDAVRAIAAAALVAMKFGWSGDMEDKIDDIIRDMEQPDQSLISLARDVIVHLEKGSSHLKEIISEAGDLEEWTYELNLIVRFLALRPNGDL